MKVRELKLKCDSIPNIKKIWVHKASLKTFPKKAIKLGIYTYLYNRESCFIQKKDD